MKIALYIEDGLEQIVLTPQSDIEKLLLRGLKNRVATIKSGEFYHCQGDWMRQGSGHDSTIIVLRPTEDQP